MEKTSAFYRCFQNLCDEKNRSPTEVIVATGLSSCLVTAWKRGTSPRLSTVMRLAKELNVPVAELLEDNIDKNK